MFEISESKLILSSRYFILIKTHIDLFSKILIVTNGLNLYMFYLNLIYFDFAPSNSIVMQSNYFHLFLFSSGCVTRDGEHANDYGTIIMANKMSSVLNSWFSSVTVAAPDPRPSKPPSRRK